jgi:hypothetical protein
MKRVTTLVAVLLAVVSASALAQDRPLELPTFTDIAEKAGLAAFKHSVGDHEMDNIAEAAGVGPCVFDYDGDGDLDIYFPNGRWTKGLSDNRGRDLIGKQRNALYRNNGDGTFTDVSKEAGVDDTGWTLDVGAADYDNDGDQDLACANDFGQDRLFRLNADATFTNVSDTALGWDTNKGMNIEFGDYNNDGWLDLYVTNIYTKEYVKEGNQLYRNNGDGTFADVSFETNVYDAGWAWAGRFWDYDNDGDLDIMVANGYISADPSDEYFTKLARTVTKPGFDPIDAHNWPEMGQSTFAGYEPKRVFRNEGNETFKEVAEELGLADKGDGRGLAIADFDNDGDLDVFSGEGPGGGTGARGARRWFIWENTDSLGGAWTEHLVREHAAECHEGVAADVDRDGAVDLCAKPWNGNLHVFLKNRRGKRR